MEIQIKIIYYFITSRATQIRDCGNGVRQIDNMAEIQNCLFVPELPKFAGYTGDDYKVKPDIDPKDFVRSMENHFQCNNITNDGQKVRLFYAQIDKKAGNARYLMANYVGRPIPWATVKEGFLKMYPTTGVDLRRSATRYLAVEVTENDVFNQATKLEATSRALAEAYLTNRNITNGEYGDTSVVSKQLTAEATDSVPTHKIKLVNVLQNFLMHIAASQTNHKIYAKLAKIGPKEDSTTFMAEIVHETGQYHALRTRNPVIKTEKEEFVWKVSSNSGRQMFQGNSTRKPGTCYNCGQEGHLKKFCTVCSFCKSRDHTAKACQKRIAWAKGKYCKNCKLKDSHDTSECRKRIYKRKGEGHVRMVHSGEVGSGMVQVCDPDLSSSDNEHY